MESNEEKFARSYELEELLYLLSRESALYFQGIAEIVYRQVCHVRSKLRKPVAKYGISLAITIS